MDHRKEKNPFYGRQHSEEVKKRISEHQKKNAALKRMRGDNPSCINPEHLWLGTNQENQLDAVRKGGRWKK